MFRANVLIIRRSKLHYTASGIVTPIGLFYSKFISCLYMFRAHVFIIRRPKLHYTASGIITPIGVHHQEVKIALHSLWHHHTYRCDDTRGCVMQFWPPDDEHMCSKHVEAWNKLIVKQTFCASSWLITEMHGQENVKKKYLFNLARH